MAPANGAEPASADAIVPTARWSLRSNEDATITTSASAAALAPSVDQDTGDEPTETERVVLEIWREVLDVPVVRVRDDFFDLAHNNNFRLHKINVRSII